MLAVESIEKKTDTKDAYKDFYLFLQPDKRMFPFSIRLEILNILDKTITNLEKIDFYLKTRQKLKKAVFNILINLLEEYDSLPSPHEHVNSEIYQLWLEQGDTYEVIKGYDWAIKFVLYKKNKIDYPDNRISYNVYKDLELEHIFPREFEGLEKQHGFFREIV